MRNDGSERAAQSQISGKEGESLVMKGSPVRVRASASACGAKRPAEVGRFSVVAPAAVGGAEAPAALYLGLTSTGTRERLGRPSAAARRPRSRAGLRLRGAGHAEVVAVRVGQAEVAKPPWPFLNRLDEAMASAGYSLSLRIEVVDVAHDLHARATTTREPLLGEPRSLAVRGQPGDRTEPQHDRTAAQTRVVGLTTFEAEAECPARRTGSRRPGR